MTHRSEDRPRRSDLQNSLLESTRRTSSLVQLISQAAAHQLKINVTDLNCLNILSLNGAMTAGQLANAAGLTTASVTGVVDRLESAGYARRDADPLDRRRVVVRLTTEAAVPDVRAVFAPVLGAWQELFAGYTDAELELIECFQRRGEELLRTHLALIRTAGPVDSQADRRDTDTTGTSGDSCRSSGHSG